MQNQEVPEAKRDNENFSTIEEPGYDGYDENGGYWNCRYPDEEEKNQDLIRQVEENQVIINTITLLTNKYLDEATSLLGLEPHEKVLVENVLKELVSKRKQGFRYFFTD